MARVLLERGLGELVLFDGACLVIDVGEQLESPLGCLRVGARSRS